MRDAPVSGLTASTGRRRILLLSPSFPPSTGGIERTASALADGLRDFEVEVVSGRPASTRGMRPPAGIPVHWAANDPPGGRLATLALTRLTVRVGLRFDPDLVLALHIRAMPAARVMARIRRSRVVLVVHAKEMREQPALARAACSWADAIVTVSSFSRELALEAGAPDERTSVIHPGVSLPSVLPVPLSARPGPPTVISVARLSDPNKGHAAALEAMARLRDRLPEVRWVMVGDGSLRSELTRRAQGLGLSDRVSFPGSLDDGELSQALGLAHAFCLLSRRAPEGRAGEGFGIVFVEAGAHGLPVVAGRIPGVIDAVEDGANGILVDPTDPGAAADALERVLLDAELGQRLADRGRARAAELAWARVVERYYAVIDQALAAPAPRSGNRGLAWLVDLARGAG
jgi:glycosyltransferase involved in cell wall biosynthesis